MNYNEGKKKLRQITRDRQSTFLKRKVAQMIIEQADGYEQIDDFFNDLFQGGCASGIIGDLIYYKQTHAFFDEYYDDIETLRLQTQEETEMTFKVESDLKNYFAWFAFEEVARQIMMEDLGIDL